MLTAWLTHRDTQKLARAAQYGYAVSHLTRFFDIERASRLLAGPCTVKDLTDARIGRYIDFRKQEDVSGETINDELKALRRGLRFNLKSKAPDIRGVDRDDRSGPRELEYCMEQVAALLEAAAETLEREHVARFTMISMSTHGRTEAILELWSRQISRGLIFFNEAGRTQTTKKRSIVPVAAPLAPWLEEVDGKVIAYRTLIAEAKWRDPNVPEYFERETYDIGKAFDACLVSAGLRNPGNGLAIPRIGKDGTQVMKLNKRTGDVVPQWRGLGTPNTLRHTIHTYLQTVGVPQAQIDAAAGHSSERGSGRNYTHLRPEYLREFVQAIENYWEEMAKLTTAHIPSQFRPKVLYLDMKERAA